MNDQNPIRATIARVLRKWRKIEHQNYDMSHDRQGANMNARTLAEIELREHHGIKWGE